MHFKTLSSRGGVFFLPLEEALVMVDSAMLKVERAAKHVVELAELIEKSKPFSYVLETDTRSRQRSTFAKKNEAVVADLATMCGDVAHNLRAALDHAYWDIVQPFAPPGRGSNNIQFPFSETAARLKEAVQNRLAHKVSPQFFQAVLDLKPPGEPGGNELLYLIDQLNVIDKHRELIPTGDYTRLSSEIIKRQVPDFPSGIVNCSFGSNARDVAWNLPSNTPYVFGSSGVLEEKLDVPVDIIFRVGARATPRPVVPTLYELVKVTKTTIAVLRANSP